MTAMKCVADDARPEDFRRPGHMFPLLAKKNGVLERNGHTEATVDLCRLAGLKEVGLCCEIMRDDGTMMRTPELIELAKQYNLKFITIKDLQAYRKIYEKLVDRVAVVKMPTKYGEFRQGRDRRRQGSSRPRAFRMLNGRLLWVAALRLRSAVRRRNDAD